MDGLEIVGPRARLIPRQANSVNTSFRPKAGTTIVECQSLPVAPFFVLILIQR